jgi:autotransporter passenger strand-loop-strand repeat protein
MTTLYISSGVKSSGLTASQGFGVTVLSGGTVDSTLVASGGALVVSAGGVSEAATVRLSGTETVYGVESGPGAVSAAILGLQIVESGGTTNAEFVGATSGVEAGGSGIDSVSAVAGVQDLFGLASVTILNGGEQIVEAQGRRRRRAGEGGRL